MIESNYITNRITGHARLNPQKTAIKYGGQSVSYLELENRSNGIAHFLNKNTKPNNNVAIILDRSPQLVETIVGVLKAGLVFFPVNPAYPGSRVKDMLAETGASRVITSPEYREKFGQAINGKNPDWLLTDEINSTRSQFDTIYNKYSYIYFTSGSTGTPKGILGRQKSLTHFIQWEIQEFGVDESFNVSQLTTPTFDPYLRDIFVPLAAGGTSCIPSQDTLLDIPELIRWIDENRINLIHMVPSLFKTLVPEIEDPHCFSHLKYILLAGEVLRGSDILRFTDIFESRIQLVNLYGTTETTLVKMFYRIKEDDARRKSIPVGKPITGAQVMILNKDMKKSMSGNTGEVYIRTPFITSGYFNDKALTKQKFIRNPFTGDPRDIIYKTGDLGRMLPDGNLEIIGRADFQVKIRGVRIELGEIENQLLRHRDVRDTVVLANEDENGEKYLCAYVVTNNGATASMLREYLSQKLPDYMIPAYFLALDKIPLTPNGKTDRKALPSPGFQQEDNYTAPRTDMERKLVRIWAEVLGKSEEHKAHLQESIGTESNFFQLGGHSLKATALAAGIQKELSVPIALGQLFKNPTIKGLSDLIKNSGRVEVSSIEPSETKEYYPLSSAQKRLYVLQQFDLNSTAYNIPRALYMDDETSSHAIEETFGKLIARHESLRTSFHIIAETPVQQVHDNVEFNLDYFEGEPEECIRKFIRPFNLSQAPLIRAALLKIGSSGERMLLFDLHHIITDGISQDLLRNEFDLLYSGNTLPQLKLQYKDYSEWQHQLLETGAIAHQKGFWLKEFAGEIPVLNLPWDYTRPAIQSFKGSSTGFELSEEKTLALNEMASKKELTLFMVLLAVYNIFLSRLSGQYDIVVGTPVAGRRHTDLEKIIGMFVNTLPLRNQPAGEKTFAGFVEELKEKTLEAFENQDYQFENIIDEVAVERDMSRNPLFDVMFTLHNITDAPGMKEKQASQNQERKTKNYRLKRMGSKVDLDLSTFEGKGKLQFTLTYCSKLFKENTIHRFAGYFLEIISSIIENPQQKLWEIEMIPDEERKQVLFDFNDTGTDYPIEKTFHQLFEEQAARSHLECAVIDEQSQLSYGELDRRADLLAHWLREKSVGPDTIVALKSERSVEMVIGILGILKSGGAYLPLDPTYPPDRINYILKDSSAVLLLTEKEISSASRSPLTGNPQPTPVHVGPTNLVYAIYTSGSTGKPKGVMIQHRALNNFIKGITGIIPFGPKDTILSLTTISFDIFGLETLLPLTRGSRVIIGTSGQQVNPGAAAQVISGKAVTILQVTPSRLTMLISHEASAACLKNLEYLLVGGEAFPGPLLEKTRELGVKRIFNMYGPTETTIWSTVKDVSAGNDLNIGKPIANTGIYILGKGNTLQPIGVTGELCIAGDGLARGYANRPELTAAKFIHLTLDAQHSILYRTGDLARWLNDGNIECLGRTDHQVKIRGFRIELGEIEVQLLKYRDIDEAAVIDRTDKNGDKYLAAFIVTEGMPDTTQLRNNLSTYLPEYMIPAYFIPIKAIPLTPNGKLDRKALPEIQLTAQQGDIPPRDDIEKKLAEIWIDVLGQTSEYTEQLRESLGINSNFFQLGGHSLKATTVISRIHKEFNVQLPLVELFKTPKIKGLAEYIRRASGAEFVSIKPVEKKEFYASSSSQRRLYVLQQLEKQTIAYNMPSAFYLPVDTNTDTVEETFRALISRHESLRTSFHTVGGEPVQKIHGNIEFHIEYFDVIPKEQEEEVQNSKFNIINSFIRPFDLSTPPLLRAAVLNVNNTPERILLIDMHHIITDGVSQDILKNEFASIYSGKSLAPLKIQYKDYSEWQRQQMAAWKGGSRRDYWLTEFTGEIPILDLPWDHHRPVIRGFEGNSTSIELNGEETRALNELAQKEKATLFMVLLAIYNIFLSRLSNQEDIVVGTPVAGRRHTDLEQIIGMFVNTLPLRNQPGGEETFTGFLEKLKEKTIRSFENQDYPYETIIEDVSVRRDTSRNPLFDVMFVMQNITDGPGPGDTPGDKTGVDKIRTYSYKKYTSKFDLSLTAFEAKGKLHFTFEYSTKLFKEKTILRLINYFQKIISRVIENPGKTISEIDFLPDEEKKQILFDFNETASAYPPDKTLHQLFEEQVEKNHGRLAVTDGPLHLTYGEFNRGADRLACMLQQKGVTPGSIVAIQTERSARMVTGIFGILKAGAVYLPIAADTPRARVQYMLKDSGATLLLTGDEIAEMCLETHKRQPEHPAPQPVTGKIGSSDLAYIIYTSGSTGNPKGVLVEHRAIVNTLTALDRAYPFGPSDVYLLKTTYTFDVSLSELFGWFPGGGALAVLEKGGEKNPQAILNTIEAAGVTHMNFVPSMFNAFVWYLQKNGIQQLSNLKYIFLAGEALQADAVNTFNSLETNVRLENIYGPTEAAIYASWYSLADWDPGTRVPIGKPLPNVKLHILNGTGQLEPIGVPGELCISGAGLARGYLNRPELTAEQFGYLNKAYGSYRTYKTGDLCRWLPDGNIEYLGRIDHQVKIRGFRIEPGEIEAQLLKCPGIDEAVVIAKKHTDGKKLLCAYIVTEKELHIPELKSTLLTSLPDYMIPSFFIPLETLPLTGSGKIDRKILETAGIGTGQSGEYEAPGNEIEQKVAEIWEEVLQVEKIGIHENFFDVGGTSLDIVKLDALFKETFNETETMVKMFRYTTIHSFANYLNQREDRPMDSQQNTNREVHVDQIKNQRAQQRQKRKRRKQ